MVRSMQCLVSGKVKGVFFRSWVHDQAVSLKLTGWVRNLEDDRVEILLQGNEEAIQDMRARLLQGSTLSRVEDLACQWIDYDKEYGEFSIRN